MDLIWRFFASTFGAYAFTAFVVLVGLIAFIGFWRQYAALRAAMQKALFIVESKDQDSGPLSHRLDEVADDLAQVTVVGDLWQEYHAHYLYVDDEGRVYRLAPPEQVFHPDVIIGRFVHTPVFSAIPGILTGLGLLGTFFGLAGGMYVAREGLTSQNILDMVSSLRALLGGASTAFYTSIAGLLTSLLFNYLYRNCMRSAHSLIEKFNQAIASVPSRSAEAILSDSHAELRRQTAALQEFSHELTVAIGQQAAAIGQHFEAHVVNALAPKLDQLITTMAQMASHQVQIQESQLSSLVSRFENALLGATSERMQQLQGVMETLIDQLTRVQSTLADGDQMIRSGMAEAAATLERSASATASALQEQVAAVRAGVEEIVGVLQAQLEGLKGQLAEGINAFGQSLGATARNFGQAIDREAQALRESLEKILDGADQLNESVRHSADEMHRVLNELRALYQAFESSLEEMRALPEAWRGVLEETGALAEEVQAAAGQVAEAATQQQELVAVIEETTATLRDHFHHLSAAWEEYRSRFEDVDRALAQVFTQINEGAAVFRDTIQSCIQSLDQSFDKGSQSFSAAVDELHTALEGLQEEVKGLNDVVRALRVPPGRR